MSWYGVDLDGTLAKLNHGSQSIGEPVPRMMERVKGWLAKGREVRIVTARASEPSLIPEVEDWLKKHGLPRLIVTNEKDFEMIECWDDRAVQVIPDTGMPMDLSKAND